MIQPKAPQSFSSLYGHFQFKYQAGCDIEKLPQITFVSTALIFSLSLFVFSMQRKCRNGPRTRERWFHVSAAVCCSVLLVHCSMFSPCSASKGFISASQAQVSCTVPCQLACDVLLILFVFPDDLYT